MDDELRSSEAAAAAREGREGAGDAGDDGEVATLLGDPDPAADDPIAEGSSSEGPTAEGPGAEDPREDEADADAGRDGPGAALSDEELLRAVSALVHASPEPLSTGRLAELLERPPRARVRAALEVLGERLAASGLALELKSLAGGWQILSTADAGEVVARLVKDRKVERVTPAALETLAIVAYRQPVTKADVEAIRGVQAGPILRTLVDRGLVKVTGRADVPGHPLLYGTTRQFLDRFGLAHLDELPRDGELARE